MAQLGSLLAGTFAVVLAWDAYLAPQALDSPVHDGLAVASADSGSLAPGLTAVTAVDRSRKGDRLAPVHSSGVAPAIARVDVGPGPAVVLRAADGNILFSSDPQARRTTIAKNVVLPQLTLRPAAPLQTIGAAPPAPAAPVMTRRQPEAKRPSGCDPAFSPIAAPQLGHIFGRCVT